MESNTTAEMSQSGHILSDPQLFFLIHILQFLGPISFLGSSLIIYVILAERRKLFKKSSYDRIILGLSSCDAVSSLALCIFGPWAIPEKATFIVGARAPNNVVCDIAGWFIHWINGSIMYSAALSIYFILLVRLEWRPEKIASKVEPWMHAIPVGVTLVTGTVSTALGYMNPVFAIPGTCWLSAFPPGCDSPRSPHVIECTRGEGSRAFLIGLGFFPFATVVIQSLSMYLLVAKVRTTELRIARYQFDRENSSSNFERTRRTAQRGLLYIASYAVAYMPPSVSIYLFATNPPTSRATAFVLSFLIACFVPLQGFFNAIIYLLPKWSELTKRGRPLHIFSKEWFSSCRGSSINSQQQQNERVPPTLTAEGTTQYGSSNISGIEPDGNLHEINQQHQRKASSTTFGVPASMTSTIRQAGNSVHFFSNASSAVKSTSSSWQVLPRTTGTDATISGEKEANYRQQNTLEQRSSETIVVSSELAASDCDNEKYNGSGNAAPETTARLCSSVDNHQNEQTTYSSPVLTESGDCDTKRPQQNEESVFSVSVTTTMEDRAPVPGHCRCEQSKSSDHSTTNGNESAALDKLESTTSSSAILSTSSATTLAIGDFGHTSHPPEDPPGENHLPNLVSINNNYNTSDFVPRSGDNDFRHISISRNSDHSKMEEEELREPRTGPVRFAKHVPTHPQQQIASGLPHALVEQLQLEDQESPEKMATTDEAVPGYDVISSASEDEGL